MTDAGDLNKSNGDIFYAEDITSLINIQGLAFKNQAQLIFNADLIGLDSDLDEEYENIFRDLLSDDSNIDSTNSEIKDVPVFGALVMDDFEDASVDTDIWTTSGTVTEANGEMNLAVNQGTSYSLADQVNARDYNDECTIFVGGKVINGSGSGVKSYYVSLVDESANEVSLVQVDFSSGTTKINYRFEVSASGNSVDTYSNYNGTGSPTAVDISSLTDGDAWHLKITLVNGNPGETANTDVYFVRYLLNASADLDFITDSLDTSTTFTDVILVANKEIGTGASATYYLSADGGSNWEEVTLNEIHRFTNTGADLRMKAVLTSSSGATDKVYILNHYAIWYNIGSTQ